MESLYSTLKDLGLDFNDAQDMEAARDVVSYLCGIMPAFELQRKLKPVFSMHEVPFSPKVFRLSLIENGYLILNLKYAALNLCFKPTNAAQLNRIHQEFGLTKNDVVLLRLCFKNRAWRSACRKSERLAEIAYGDVTLEAMQQAIEVYTDIKYEPLMKHIRGLAYRKLRFLVKAENAELADYHGELMCKAVKEYYRMIPTAKSEAHVLNCLRTACNNHATNIIEAQTTKKRRRMLNDGGDGFGGFNYGMKVLSENQLRTDADFTVDYDASLNDSNLNQNARLLSQLNFECLVRNLGVSATRRRALLIVSGHEDKRFSHYLRAIEVIPQEEDSADFVHRFGFNTVVSHLSNHLRVKENRLRRFLEYAGSQLRNEEVSA